MTYPLAATPRARSKRPRERRGYCVKGPIRHGHVYVSDRADHAAESVTGEPSRRANLRLCSHHRTVASPVMRSRESVRCRSGAVISARAGRDQVDGGEVFEHLDRAVGQGFLADTRRVRSASAGGVDTQVSALLADAPHVQPALLPAGKQCRSRPQLLGDRGRPDPALVSRLVTSGSRSTEKPPLTWCLPRGSNPEPMD